MTTIHSLLEQYRNESENAKELGTKFERLIQRWYTSAPAFAGELKNVYLWEQFPYRHYFGATDLGIDLVAQTHTGEYWAIQCKCYAPTYTITKGDTDSFIATANRSVTVETEKTQVRFSQIHFVATTNRFGKNVLETFFGQNIPAVKIDLNFLEHSGVDWQKLASGLSGLKARQSSKELRPHQSEAIEKARAYYADNDRGKLVMACGTGKTFTSLRLVEEQLPNGGFVLFLVPSIALLSQSLNDWYIDAQRSMHAVCVCSDNRASRKVRRGDDDDTESGQITDLAQPASTTPEAVVARLEKSLQIRQEEELTVVFSTYQSIEVVHQAQRLLAEKIGAEQATFDFIICDEAHRTTGVKISGRVESHFTQVHDNDFLRSHKRLYMTATPRLYGDEAKAKASRSEMILCSMDDERIYGEEIHRVNFSYAVQNGILTDYKVLVLTVSESLIPTELRHRVRNRLNQTEDTHYTYSDVGKLIGIINGLSKKIMGDDNRTWQADPRLMRRALAFTSKIGSTTVAGSSKHIEDIFPKVSELYNDSLSDEEQKTVVHIQARHVDGGMNASERNEALAWLADESQDPQECRVLTNVRCLSEGVDVPALDAVLFLSSRNSPVDVVQSVGRVMRSFAKGTPEEKRYGYIIIPVIVPEGISAEEALNDNKTFAPVWTVLNSLRAHDDHFNAIVNSINLNKDKKTKVIIGPAGLGRDTLVDPQTQQDEQAITEAEIAQQLPLLFEEEFQNTIYAKLVEKCGERTYWESWGERVAGIARDYSTRIGKMVLAGGVDATEEHTQAFEAFLSALRQNLNPGITTEAAIEMLAQHLITKPVFTTLFKDYNFVNNNSISQTMEAMIERLQSHGVDDERQQLHSFYDSVSHNVGQIDNLAGKQNIIKNLYERFFRSAFRATVDRLGIVYTPTECVDFILHSADDILRNEFGTALTNPGVHILDPFTGTGTFITRLLQSGLIHHEDLQRKYSHEIHANELVMLAYYIADINIESVFHDIQPQQNYLPYNGICLTDTFQMSQKQETDLFGDYFIANSKAVQQQRQTPVRVIIGNPPYSAGQRNANDNNKNQSYPQLEQRIRDTYAKRSAATNKNSIQDLYIKAFRWATDRLSPTEGGLVAYISNGSWIDSSSGDGLRACLAEDFDKIYVLNLRGNLRTQGELAKKEGGGIFGEGSRTPIAITFLIRYGDERRAKTPCQIYYHDIGDYLSRKQKLEKIKEFRTYLRVNWQSITPTDKYDWINQRDGAFDALIPLEPKKKFDLKAEAVFNINSNGINTNRDGWVYGFSKEGVAEQTQRMISFYNEQLSAEEPSYDKTKISWSGGLLNRWDRKEEISFAPEEFVLSAYRPFNKEHLYYHKPLIERERQFRQIFPHGKENLVIALSGIGANDFSCLISDNHVDYGFVSATRCFPMYWYEQAEERGDLFGSEARADKEWVRHEAITDWILAQAHSTYQGSEITKEDIFYYVYALLHSPDYRQRYASDLKKGLPRLLWVASPDDFFAFARIGRQLAKLHLSYESLPAPEGVRLISARSLDDLTPPTDENLAYCHLEKMNHPSKDRRDTIIYNSRIRIEGIPQEAYDYLVNGRSPLAWVMERYQRKQDKDTLLVSDPNDWLREQEDPTYVLRLLLSLITLSLQTQRLVRSLPSLSL